MFRSPALRLPSVLFTLSFILASTSAIASTTEQNAARAAYAKLRLSFVPNAGQIDPRVRYMAQSGRSNFYFTAREVVFRAMELSQHVGVMEREDGFERYTGAANVRRFAELVELFDADHPGAQVGQLLDRLAGLIRVESGDRRQDQIFGFYQG